MKKKVRGLIMLLISFALLMSEVESLHFVVAAEPDAEISNDVAENDEYMSGEEESEEESSLTAETEEQYEISTDDNVEDYLILDDGSDNVGLAESGIIDYTDWDDEIYNEVSDDGVGDSGFWIRDCPPDRDNKYYYDSAYNANVGDTRLEMPNCTTYVLGRVYEICGKRFNVAGNAKQYYENAKGKYEVSNDPYKPALGAVVCLQNGGNGHVCFVEKID